jgi:acetoin utilization protein AcuC
MGQGAGEGFTVNMSLPPGAGDKCMILFLEEVFKPLVNEFKPQVIIRNGGSDPHFMDGLGGLNLTFLGLRSIGEAVAEAAKTSNCGVVDLCCSGYNPTTVAEGWLSILSGIIGWDISFKEPAKPPIRSEKAFFTAEKVIKSLKNKLGEYWSF